MDGWNPVLMNCFREPERPMVVSVALATVARIATVTVTVAVAVAVPSVAVSVTGYEPAAAGVPAVANEMEPEVPVPGCVTVAVSPVGRPPALTVVEAELPKLCVSVKVVATGVVSCRASSAVLAGVIVMESAAATVMLNTHLTPRRPSQ
jgi:hypothetical protein